MNNSPLSSEDQKLIMDTFHKLYPYSSGPHLNEINTAMERALRYARAEAEARPGIMAALDNYQKENGQQATRIAELEEEVSNLKIRCSTDPELQRHEKELIAIQSAVSSPAESDRGDNHLAAFNRKYDECEALKERNSRLVEWMKVMVNQLDAAGKTLPDRFPATRQRIELVVKEAKAAIESEEKQP